MYKQKKIIFLQDRGEELQIFFNRRTSLNPGISRSIFQNSVEISQLSDIMIEFRIKVYKI